MRTEPANTLIRMLMYLVLTGGLMGAPLALAVDIGQPAPDFTLPSSTGDTISLSQFKEKKHVLIQFYTLDFNPT
jgi:cytochrome oxidase Cu insertion factor (SCO1/SenC/PrrC family)